MTITKKRSTLYKHSDDGTTFIGTGLMILPAMSVSQLRSFAFYAWLITAVMIIPIALFLQALGFEVPFLHPAGGRCPPSHYIGRGIRLTLRKKAW